MPQKADALSFDANIDANASLFSNFHSVNVDQTYPNHNKCVGMQYKKYKYTWARLLITRRGAKGAPPVAGKATRASGSGLYFQGGFDRRRKYRAPQQDIGSSPASATIKTSVFLSKTDVFLTF